MTNNLVLHIQPCKTTRSRYTIKSMHIRGAGKGKRAERANIRLGERLTEPFCNLNKFRFKNRVGRILVLQIFCIIHLINAEILAKFCTKRNKNKVGQNDPT